MSFDALAWAAKCRVINSADKLVLLGLAECASRDEHLAWPSIASLVEFGSLNRKTVIVALGRLEAAGFISATGNHVGRTKQIKVYRLHVGTVPKSEPYLNRNSSEISMEQSQKGDTEPVREPVPSEAKASSGLSARSGKFSFPCPDDVDPVDWDALKAIRKEKRAGLTESAHRSITKRLNNYRQDGWPPGPIVALAAERGWATVWPTDEMKEAENNSTRNGTRTPAARAPRQSSRAERLFAAKQRAAAERQGEGSFPHLDDTNEIVDPVVRAGIAREARRRERQGEGNFPRSGETHIDL